MSLRNVTLRQLGIFAGVAHHLNLTRAAAELHLTPPAVSMQMRELQRIAGAPLITIEGKTVALTPAGQRLLQHALAIFEHLREADEAIDALRTKPGGQLRVAVIGAGDYFFPALLAAFCARHPACEPSLYVNNRDDILRQLKDGTVDLAVMGRPPDDAGYNALAIAPHPNVVVAAPGHAVARRRNIPLEDIAGETMIVRELGSDTRIAMQETFAARKIVPARLMEIRSNETIKRAVAAGFGLGFLSAHAVVLEVRTRQLKILDLQGFPVMRQWYAVHREKKRLPPVAAAFRQFLQTEGEALITASLGA